MIAGAGTPTEMRDFIERYVGPMVLKPDGDVDRKETVSESEAVVKRSIATAGYEPPRRRRA